MPFLPIPRVRGTVRHGSLTCVRAGRISPELRYPRTDTVEKGPPIAYGVPAPFFLFGRAGGYAFMVSIRDSGLRWELLI